MSRILIVDDDPDIRTALADLLGLLLADRVRAGTLAIDPVASGEEAVAAAAAGAPLAAIVMDVHLPGIDGVEAFFRIAEARGGRPVPTVFLTGYAGSGWLQERLAAAMAAGAVAVLSKPVSAGALLKHVERLVAPASISA
jgi:CheY-like chemotaxis protein